MMSEDISEMIGTPAVSGNSAHWVPLMVLLEVMWANTASLLKGMFLGIYAKFRSSEEATTLWDFP